MKRFLLFLIGFSCLLTRAEQGTEGHGGSPDEMDFVDIGKRLADHLRTDLAKEFPEVNPDLFDAAVRDTKVAVKDGWLEVDGRTVAAINHPKEKFIEVSGEHWMLLSGRGIRKVALVFHEYLGILKVEQDVYTVSARLSKRLNTDPVLLSQLVCSEDGCGDGVADTLIMRSELRIGKNQAPFVSLGVGFSDSSFDHPDLTFCFLGRPQDVCGQIRAFAREKSIGYGQGDHDFMVVKKCEVGQDSEGTVAVEAVYELGNDYEKKRSSVTRKIRNCRVED